MQTPDGNLLYRLLTQPHVHVFVIPVGGTTPPSGFDRVRHAGQTREVVENWALYEVIDARGRTHLFVRSAAGDEPIETLLNVDDEPFKWSAGVPVDEPFELPIDEEGRAGAAFQTLVAKELQCDLYITDAPDAVDLDGETGYRYPTEIITPEAAIPLLGLYLRGVGRYRLETDRQLGRRQPVIPPIRGGEDVVVFWHTAARSMLWAADDWEHIDDLIPDPAKSEAFAVFAESVLHRLDQLLRERDVLLRFLAVAPAGIEAGYLAERSLDVILLLALAAVDATAEAVAAAFDLDAKRRAWTDERFLKKLSAACTGLADLFQPHTGGDHYAVWQVLSVFRNAIHAEPLSHDPRIPVVHDYAGRTLLPIPPARFDDVKRYLTGMDGLDRWGVYEGVNGSNKARLHPGEFVEQLVPRVFALVQRIMVEALKGKEVPMNKTWGNRYGRPLSGGEADTLRMLGLGRVAYDAT